MKTKRYYKNQNQILLCEINSCNTKINELQKHLDNYDEIINVYENKLKQRENELKKAISSDARHQVAIIKLKDEIKQKNKEIKDTIKTKDKEILELKIKLENSIPVIKLKSEKVPKGQRIGIKSGARESKIIANIYKEVKDEEK